MKFITATLLLDFATKFANAIAMKCEETFAKKGDIPAALPASDVHDWAKAETKPQYTAGEVGADEAGAAATALSNAKDYTNTKIADLINGAPTTLDTLGEIANEMATNKNVVEALNSAIGEKVNQTAFDSHKNDAGVHVPSGGAAGQILGRGASGLIWIEGTESATTADIDEIIGTVFN